MHGWIDIFSFAFHGPCQEKLPLSRLNLVDRDIMRTNTSFNPVLVMMILAFATQPAAFSSSRKAICERVAEIAELQCKDSRSLRGSCKAIKEIRFHSCMAEAAGRTAGLLPNDSPAARCNQGPAFVAPQCGGVSTTSQQIHNTVTAITEPLQAIGPKALDPQAKQPSTSPFVHESVLNRTSLLAARPKRSATMSIFRGLGKVARAAAVGGL